MIAQHGDMIACYFSILILGVGVLVWLLPSDAAPRCTRNSRRRKYYKRRG